VPLSHKTRHPAAAALLPLALFLVPPSFQKILFAAATWFHYIISLDTNMQCNTRRSVAVFRARRSLFSAGLPNLLTSLFGVVALSLSLGLFFAAGTPTTGTSG
jgi:hypothetical protein